MHQHKLVADGIERIFGKAGAWASRTSNVAAMLRLMARRVAPAIKGGGAHATADV
jgi:hypothetical protein